MCTFLRGVPGPDHAVDPAVVQTFDGGFDALVSWCRGTCFPENGVANGV